MTAFSPGAQPVRFGRIRRATLATLILLLAQFAVGIVANLYVTVPAHHPGAHPSNYFTGSLRSLGWALGHGPAALAVHAALGILIALAAIGLAVQCYRLRHWGLATLAIVGALAVIGAGFNGASFLDYGMNVNSLVMSLLFALAVLCYLWITYLTPGSDRDER